VVRELRWDGFADESLDLTEELLVGHDRALREVAPLVAQKEKGRSALQPFARSALP